MRAAHDGEFRRARLARGLAPVGLALLALLAAGCEAPPAEPLARAGALALETPEGAGADPLGGDAAATVVVFVRRDCPIANRYVPELERLAARFRPEGVRFIAAYVDPEVDRATIAAHREEYGITLEALVDRRHELVRLVEAQATPTAALFDDARGLFYAGRIDDRYRDFGKAAREAGSRDLEQAIEALLAGRPVARRTEAVGCFIEDLEPNR